MSRWLPLLPLCLLHSSCAAQPLPVVPAPTRASDPATPGVAHATPTRSRREQELAQARALRDGRCGPRDLCAAATRQT